MKNEKVYGYVYNKDGYHSRPITMEYNAEAISSFIMRGYMAGGSLQITDMLDLPILQTVPHSYFIDYCRDQEFLTKELH